MRIVIGGASGLIGRLLTDSFTATGDTVIHLVRRSPEHAGEAQWDPAAGRLDPEVLDRADAVINIGGAGIGDHRWTAGYRRLLLDSRLQPTALLARSIAALGQKPALFISASAVGYYGDRPANEPLTEHSAPGSGFLAGLCRQWEEAAMPAADAGVRTIITRSGIVLDAKDGALGKMLPPFKAGIGGRVGSGRQMVSWIAGPELPAVYRHLLNTSSISGPVNLVAPGALSNADFGRVLADALNRPTLGQVPAIAIRAALGEMGSELLLKGQNVVPAKLLESGYRFRWPELQEALGEVL